MPQQTRNFLQKIDFGDRWPDPDKEFMMSEREVGRMIATLPIVHDHPACLFLKRFVFDVGNEGNAHHVPVIVQLRDRVKSRSVLASSQPGRDLLHSIDTALQKCTDPVKAKEQEVKTLETQYADAWSSERISILDRIWAVEPTAARKLAAKFLPGEDIGWLDAFRILCTSNAIPDEARWLDAVLEVPPGSTVSGKQALRLLVPVSDPMRFADPRIDAALRRLVQPPKQDSNAALALYFRGQHEFSDRVKPTAEVVDRLLEFCQTVKKPDAAPLRRLVIPQLREDLTEEQRFWSLWMADFRELEPDVQARATSSPDDYEDVIYDNLPNVVRPNGIGARCQSVYVSGMGSDQILRFHAARQVTALWNEPDPVTRLKLLVAPWTDCWFAWSNLAQRMAAEIHPTAASLSAEEKQEVLRFLDWCVTQKYLRPGATNNSEARLIIFTALQKELGWPGPSAEKSR